eukprot:Phypoly_transcript_14560.p1 GENE.Phypoly_transcript_14560~~Phypoly_transcript_14560.p1  ORF type:complete len:317 (+),score=89.70 Phypoly_transcript_14560:105-953(+)
MGFPTRDEILAAKLVNYSTNIIALKEKGAIEDSVETTETFAGEEEGGSESEVEVVFEELEEINHMEETARKNSVTEVPPPPPAPEPVEEKTIVRRKVLWPEQPVTLDKIAQVAAAILQVEHQPADKQAQITMIREVFKKVPEIELVVETKTAPPPGKKTVKTAAKQQAEKEEPKAKDTPKKTEGNKGKREENGEREGKEGAKPKEKPGTKRHLVGGFEVDDSAHQWESPRPKEPKGKEAKHTKGSEAPTRTSPRNKQEEGDKGKAKVEEGDRKTRPSKYRRT